MNNIILSGGVNSLEKFTTDSSIIVKAPSILNAINLCKDINLDIKINAGASLVINLFDYADNETVNIRIESYDNSSLTINSSFIAAGKYELNIDENLYGDNIKCDVFIRGINEAAGIVKIDMTGTVAGETKGSVLNEYARIINKSENSSVLIPNLIVNTNEVIANHGVSIGGFRNDELFYLASKGIDEETSKKLIEEGFINSIFDSETRDIVKNVLIGR